MGFYVKYPSHNRLKDAGKKLGHSLYLKVLICLYVYSRTACQSFFSGSKFERREESLNTG